MSLRILTGTVFLLVAALVRTSNPIAAQEKLAEGITFVKDVQPIFKKHCITCHNAERPRGELDLSSVGGIAAGGVSGKAAIAGKADESPIYLLAAHLDAPKMPPNKSKIPLRELDVIKAWINGGMIEKKGASETVAILPKSTGGLQMATALARSSPTTALAAHPSKHLIALPGRQQILLFESDEKLLGALPFPEGELHVLRFSRDGRILLAGGGVGGQSGKVVGFDTSTWNRKFEFGDENDAVLAADLSPDGTKVVFGGPSRVVKVFSVIDRKQLHVFRKSTDWVVSATFSPEGLLVAAGDRFGGLYVWETKSGKEFHTLRGHTGAVNGLAWRADSNVLASAGADGTLRTWNMHTGSQIGLFEAHAEGVSAVDWHSGGEIATGGRDHRVKVWKEDGKLVREFGPGPDQVLRVAFIADGKGVVSGDWTGTARIWRGPGQPAAALPIPLQLKTNEMASISVPIPPVPTAGPIKTKPTLPIGSTQSDLDRKRALLKSVEESAEMMKNEAARNPKNTALTKAYLQLCEAVLAAKADLLEAESQLKELSK